MPFSSHAKNKLLQLFILGCMSPFSLARKNHKMFSFIQRVAKMPKILEVGEDMERMKMTKKDKNNWEENVIDNLWHGWEAVINLKENTFSLKFQIVRQDFLEIPLITQAYYNRLKVAWLTLSRINFSLLQSMILR